jgi:transcriptional regulator with XRE-family HTH domain
MARSARKIHDRELAQALRNALLHGALSVRDGLKVMRALEGYSQQDAAVVLGVSPKVIKAIESGRGNPSYSSLNQIASAFGLRLAFVAGEAKVGLMDSKDRLEEKQRLRSAENAQLARGEVSEAELRRRNAVRVDEIEFELPSLA